MYLPLAHLRRHPVLTQLGESRPGHSLVSQGLEAVSPKIVLFLKLEEIALDVGEKRVKVVYKYC